MAPVPLCIDLDGTLCRSDTLVEALLAVLKHQPWVALLLPLWLLSGRAAFKQKIAERAALNPGDLPWRDDLLQDLQQERQRGRSIYLVTGADQRVARACADHHPGLFDGVIASDGRTNLTGSRKRAALVERFGERGFDYAGDATVDLKVWASARAAWVAGPNTALRAKAATLTAVEQDYPQANGGAKAWIKALRAHQWVKNVLIFVPILLAQKLDAATLFDAVLAFIAFSLCASSVYLLNDLLDLAADRAHPRKCLRPFAAARLPLISGVVLAPALLLAAFLVAAFTRWEFVLVLAAYYVLTLAYSLYLKRMPLIDVLMLAGLYTIRIIAGVAATGVVLSFWLLAFSVFLFLSLGIVKRYAEMDMVKASAGEKAAGRGYHIDDLPLLGNLGTAAGYGAVVVLALYVNSPESQMVYAHPRRLWLLAPLVLYWVSRVWLKTHRGEMHDDPIVFALKDRASRLVGVIGLAVVLSASL